MSPGERDTIFSGHNNMSVSLRWDLLLLAWFVLGCLLVDGSIYVVYFLSQFMCPC